SAKAFPENIKSGSNGSIILKLSNTNGAAVSLNNCTGNNMVPDCAAGERLLLDLRSTEDDRFSFDLNDDGNLYEDLIRVMLNETTGEFVATRVLPIVSAPLDPVVAGDYNSGFYIIPYRAPIDLRSLPVTDTVTIQYDSGSGTRPQTTVTFNVTK
ncbi:MAG: hypothetical protein WCP97_06005, partial [bacterium]